MPEKCTKLSRIAQAALMSQFQPGLDPDEEKQASQVFDQYLFYSTRGRARVCLCTSCCNTWTTTRSKAKDSVHKHNDLGYCPQCHARVTYKALGRLGRTGSYPSLHEEHNLVLFRAAADGALLISAGRIVAEYLPGQTDGWSGVDEIIFPVPTLDFWERHRYYLAPGVVQHWTRAFGLYKGPWGFPSRYESVWETRVSAGEPNPADSSLFPQPDGGRYQVLGWENLSKTKLCYSAVEQYFDPEMTLFRGVVTYLARYAKRPQMEMLVKLGHTEIIDRMLDEDTLSGHLVNWRAKTPLKCPTPGSSRSTAIKMTGAAPTRCRYMPRFWTCGCPGCRAAVRETSRAGPSCPKKQRRSKPHERRDD